MSSRTDLNEAALNMTKLLTLITGLNDEQVDALMLGSYTTRHLKYETLNMLQRAIKRKGTHSS